MIIWGGQDASPVNRYDGARYNPATDTWTPMSTVGAPSARQASSAVWTGREMIVWGGADNSGSVNTGGRYNPAMDAWVASTTTAGAPTARQSHSGIWTGSRMIVTHGGILGNGMLNTGGIHQPPIPAFGPHTATITISAPGASNSPQTITVDLTVIP
jgi:N-acetylneuraminic acid mutarotase